MRDWHPFATLLDDAAVVKVLHACSEDLEMLLRLTGSLPQPLFDTQLAAGYLNIGFSMGYSRLVQARARAKSDWLQRPLSEDALRRRGCQHSAELSAARSCRTTKSLGAGGGRCRGWSPTQRESDPEEAYREVKQAWRLKPQQLAVLKVPRVARAPRRRHQPRNRVLREASLWPLARTQPVRSGYAGAHR